MLHRRRKYRRRANLKRPSNGQRLESWTSPAMRLGALEWGSVFLGHPDTPGAAAAQIEAQFDAAVTASPRAVGVAG